MKVKNKGIKVSVGWAKKTYDESWIAGGYLVTAAIARKINNSQMSTTVRAYGIDEETRKREMVRFEIGKRYY